MASGWQLLDRPAEQHAIRSALRDRERSGVVLAGPAGVGKTTLARTVTASLESPAHWTACTESSRSIPLGVFAQLVQASSSPDPIALMAAARASLLAHDHPVIAIDDAHLLDPLSATLLHQIAVDRAAHIVATVRTGEPVPDAVISLWKDGYLQRLDLHPFTQQQSIRLVESALGGTLEGLSADIMWESSGGNPLFLRNLVEGAVDAGSLTEVNGVWQLRGSTVVPTGFAALLQSRLDRVGDDVINALKLLALCEPLDSDALCELAGDDAVDAAEVAGLIRVVDDGPQLNARFCHPLYGEVLRHRIGKPLARKLKGQLVHALRDRKVDTAASRIRIAQLYVDSDQTVDTDVVIAAANDAIVLSDLPLGERLARAAFQRGGGLKAAALLSRATLWQGRPRQAEEILAQFDPDDLDELQLVRWGVPRLAIRFWLIGDVTPAHELLALLRERVTNPVLAMVVEATAAALAVNENRIADGLGPAERILADNDAPDQAFEFAAFTCALGMPVVGRGGEFQPIAARCRDERRATDGMIRVMIRYGEVLGLAYTGDLDLADQRVAEYAEFSSAGQFLGWAIAKIMAGVVATRRGHFPDAISSFEQALAAQTAEDPLPWRLPARVVLARAYAAVGNAEQAQRVLTDAREHTGPSVALFDPQLMIAKSWVSAAKGAVPSAIDQAHAAADLTRRTGQYAIEAEALHDAARFGDRTVASRLEALAQSIDGRVAPLYARHAAAVADSDGPALDSLSVEFEQAGLLLAAADSAAQAAPLHERAKNRAFAAESAARALELADQCGGAATPAIRAVARPLPVTAREREVAALVADGLSNREIADRLSLSIRTVEGHLYRACIKLDVTDRDQLARVVSKRTDR